MKKLHWGIVAVAAVLAISWYLFSAGRLWWQQTPGVPVTSTTPFTPPGYKGPTSAPHINGPSGPPPNY